MSIADLIPWKKKTEVPVEAREEPLRVLDRETEGVADTLWRWLGLAPSTAFGPRWRAFGPPMDVIENDQAFKVTMEVPGIDKDDIEVRLVQDRLTIRGKQRGEEEHRGRDTYRLRRSRRIFRRSVELPGQIDRDQVTASLRRGVLTVQLPKRDGARHRKRISVKRR